MALPLHADVCEVGWYFDLREACDGVMPDPMVFDTIDGVRPCPLAIADPHAHPPVPRVLDLNSDLLGDTEVGEGTKIASHVIVSHGCRIGRRCLLASRAFVNGLSVLGDGVAMGPCSTLSNQLGLGAGSRTVIGDLVTRDVPPGTMVVRNALVSFDRYREVTAWQRATRFEPAV